MSFMPETNTDTAVRPTEVQQEFAKVDEATGYIDKMMSELEERLSHSILAQRKEIKTESASTAPEPVRVPLAQSLYEHAVRLERIRERLSSILSRIEA